MNQIIAQNNMKQIVASVFCDILSYTIGNIIFCLLYPLLVEYNYTRYS